MVMRPADCVCRWDAKFASAPEARVGPNIKSSEGPQDTEKGYSPLSFGGYSPWAISENNFRLQMEWLCRTGTLISLEQSANREISATRCRSQLRSTTGTPAFMTSCFLYCRDVGQLSRLCLLMSAALVPTVSEILRTQISATIRTSFSCQREISDIWSDKGWSVGSHGVGHLDLTAVSEETARRELAESKRMIENMLSVPCTLFAYTWGKHNARLRRLRCRSWISIWIFGSTWPAAIRW